ncbi:chromatin assembly factor 1 subunit A-B [Teleopsis dalmanni]|uniref:chromatin assembly factor 1 subunit A-B n=1 Tax=Teleopsis dalmanni TaxID=139649 RepID=UPI0018CE3F2D|nr:chromatin assembly factor 1 subunit A-B [Teleopsis dalmanni]
MSNLKDDDDKPTSGKKMVQARLPFKIIPPAPSVSTSEITTESKNPPHANEHEIVNDSRKRKLSYSDEEHRENVTKRRSVSKENSTNNKKRKSDVVVEDSIVLIDEIEDCDNKKIFSSSHISITSDKSNNTKSKLKGARTPQSADKSKKNLVKIKLPLSSTKIKRSKLSLEKSDAEEPTLSDDMEIIAEKCNPQKRQKQDQMDVHDTKTSTPTKLKDETPLKTSNESNLEVISISDIDSENTHEDDCADGSISSNDLSSRSKKSSKNLSEKMNTSKKIKQVNKNNLTPKQLKIDEQRRRLREEKEHKLNEMKLQKQKEKEDKELARKRERDEKENQKRKEREEKDEQKRKDREEKERKRLADIEIKNEEKRKRVEAKEEEQRKKDEDRRRREQEKEDADLKKKKAAEAFTKFFVPKRNILNAKLEQIPPNNCDESACSLAFRPFQIRNDMKLAPVLRRDFTKEAHSNLDECLKCAQPISKLYIDDLKNGTIIPGKWRPSTVETKTDIDDEIYIVDDFELAGQELVEETHGPIDRFRTKFFKFSENRRPPYHGTWRKRSTVIRPKNPFAKDTNFFDYDIDSDLEWEEEEPGESLDGSDDDKEKESEDDDYEVDNEWFVPHGHLSEEELQTEDDKPIGEDNINNREAQKAKLKILQQQFAQEMKKKTEKIKPRLIGCIWVDENGNQPDQCPKIIWDTLGMGSMLYTSKIMINEPEISEKNEPSSPSTQNLEKTGDKLKPLILTEKLQNDLVRLVHGNSHSKVFLIKEFIAYVEATEESVKNGDVKGPLKSTIRDKIDEFAEWKITEMKSKKKNKIKKRLCWIVSDDILNKMGLNHLDLHNKWEYNLQPRFVLKDDQFTTDGENVDDVYKNTSEASKAEEKTENKSALNCFNKSDAGIKKFTKSLANQKKEKQSEIENTFTEDPNVNNDSGSSTQAIAETNAKTNPIDGLKKKRVPLLMSVPRGHHFPVNKKNALISQFIQNNLDKKFSKSNEAVGNCSEDIIVLD